MQVVQCSYTTPKLTMHQSIKVKHCLYATHTPARLRFARPARARTCSGWSPLRSILMRPRCLLASLRPSASAPETTCLRPANRLDCSVCGCVRLAACAGSAFAPAATALAGSASACGRLRVRPWPPPCTGRSTASGHTPPPAGAVDACFCQHGMPSESPATTSAMSGD